MVVLVSIPTPAMAEPYECLIVPNQTVDVRSPTDGLIEKVLVKRGDFVTEGQTLVMLESSVQRSAVQIAKYRSEMGGRIESSKSRLSYAKKKLSRTQELQKKELISTQLSDEAEAEHQIAEAELSDAIENQMLAKQEYLHSVNLLSQRTLRSPLSGVVVDRMLNPGDLAESGTGPKPILKLAQINPLQVEVTLPLEVYGKLSVGMTGAVTPEGGKEGFSAKVTIVDSVFDAASGMFGARLELKNDDGAIPGGIRCRVDFETLGTLADNQTYK
jgi:RND family efflux transporter MFP subunit